MILPGAGNPRPRVTFGHVWCDICDKECDFMESAVYRGGDQESDEILNGGGAVLIQASCHGTTADIMISFDNLRKIQQKHKYRIVAFANELALENETRKIIDQPKLLPDTPAAMTGVTEAGSSSQPPTSIQAKWNFS